MGILRNLILRISYFIEEYGIIGWFVVGSVHLFVVISAWSIPVLLFNPWAPYFSADPSPSATPQPAAISTSLSAQGTMDAVMAQVVTPTPTLEIRPGVSYEAGIYLVNTEIQPGLYRGQGGTEPTEACYWARLRDLTEAFEAIIASAESQGQFYVEIKSSDLALEVNCTITSLDPNLPQVSAYPQQLSQGMYLIGAEILPGRYQGQAGDQACSWERLSGVDGEPGSLIANGEEQGQFVVEILPSDFSFSTTCSLERLDG